MLQPEWKDPARASVRLARDAPPPQHVLDGIALRYVARLLGHEPTMADAVWLPGIDLEGLLAGVRDS
jgi:hypothetical protein